MKYDYLVVGSGLFGAVFTQKAVENGKTCLVIERRPHIGGNCYTEVVEGIDVHKYGAHIFRTSNVSIWEYIRQFGEFNNFVNSPIAMTNGKLYNLPFNMNTFYQLWGCTSPQDAMDIIDRQREEVTGSPQNLEEKAISLVGRDVYELLIKGYTEKQWGRPCCELPASIIRRIPVRFTFDNNYFNARYQGIPETGYTDLLQRMLEGADVELNVDFNCDKQYFSSMAKTVVYTGPIDALFDYRYGRLEYRSLRFEHKVYDLKNFQGVAVVNYTDKSVPYTRTIEHKHFVFGNQARTVVSYEFPQEGGPEVEPYYPINNYSNQVLYDKYITDLSEYRGLYVGGRLGEYKYYDMQDTIASAINLFARLNSGHRVGG